MNLQLLQQMLAETDEHGHYKLQGTMLPYHLVGRHADILEDEGTMEEEDVVPARVTMGWMVELPANAQKPNSCSACAHEHTWLHTTKLSCLYGLQCHSKVDLRNGSLVLGDYIRLKHAAAPLQVMPLCT